MKKLLALGFAVLLSAGNAHAAFIQQVTGADMTGMEVTVEFTNGSTETLTWALFSADPSAPNLEGYSGGVTPASLLWGLSQAGDTIGEYIAGPLGVWTLYNEDASVGIHSLFINAWAGNVVFDTAFGDASMNGSGPGREFTYDNSNTTVMATFSNNYMDELYGGLTITGAGGSSLLPGTGIFQFQIDTEIVKTVGVPAPATLAIALLALVGLAFRRKTI